MLYFCNCFFLVYLLFIYTLVLNTSQCALARDLNQRFDHEPQLQWMPHVQLYHVCKSACGWVCVWDVVSHTHSVRRPLRLFFCCCHSAHKDTSSFLHLWSPPPRTSLPVSPVSPSCACFLHISLKSGFRLMTEMDVPETSEDDGGRKPRDLDQS